MHKPGFTFLRSWAEFDGPIQKAIHRMKYRQDLTLGFELARLMTDFIDDLKWPIDIVVPVPLSKKRRSERGYNQAGLIAYPLALKYGWKYVPDGLTRVRETGSQVGLNVVDRQKNVQGAFKANPDRVVKKKVLLIDDVATTGATLSSCTEALTNAGALEIFALTIARARTKYGVSAI